MSQRIINVIGNIFGTSGYASHTRNLANAINEYMPVKLICQMMPGWERQVTDKELEMIKRPEGDTNLIIAMPHQWNLYTTGKVNIGFLVWEGDKIPKSWIEDLLNPDIDYIFVPSQHTKDAICNTVVDWNDKAEEVFKKIHIMPHGVSDIFKPKETKRDKFTFLCNKGFTNLEDRGGIQYMLKAYNEEFTDEKVQLILKINPAYGIPNMNLLMKQLGYTEKSPTVILATNEIPTEQMPSLYNNCDVFVSPTRAEAFNLPCIEAMACQKPVITTNFGGQTDFCNESNSWIIDGELKEVQHDIMYEGIKWLTPNIDKLKHALREAYTKPKLVSSKGIKALETSKSYTWAKTAEKIVNLIN